MSSSFAWSTWRRSFWSQIARAPQRVSSFKVHALQTHHLRCAPGPRWDRGGRDLAPWLGGLSYRLCVSFLRSGYCSYMETWERWVWPRSSPCRYAGSDHASAVESFFRERGFRGDHLPRAGRVGKDSCRSCFRKRVILRPSPRRTTGILMSKEAMPR